MSGKILTVAVREFSETVRTRAFFLSSVLMPVVLVGLVFGAEAVQRASEQTQLPTRTLAVIDHTGALRAPLEQLVAEYNAQQPQRPFALEPLAAAAAPPEDALAARVLSGELYAYLIIPADALEPAAEAEVVLARKDSKFTAQMHIQQLITAALRAARFAVAGIDPSEVERLSAAPRFVQVDVLTGSDTETSELARFMTPFAFMFLLFMGTFGISQGLLTSLIEEKSTRVIEVLLAAVSPLQLMVGKIVGMVGVGLLLLLIWGTLGLVTARYQQLAHLVSVYDVTIAALYFLPAFLMFAGLLGAIGAAFNTLKEAQSMAFPLSLVSAAPLILWFQIFENPSAPLSVVLSFVPVVTPFVMILRVTADPATPVWQIVATLALLWLTVVAVLWMAAKVFRVGLLMYGKPPSLGELWRWIRQA